MKRRVRATGPTAAVVDAVIERAQGLCEVGGELILGDVRGVDWSISHRIPRGMGGSRRPELNQPQNLMLACGSGTTGHHGAIEQARAGAYAAGWLLHRTADPAAEPVLIGGTRWVLLTPDGQYRDCAPPAGVSA